MNTARQNMKHGMAEPHRDDGRGFDKWVWDNGLQLTIYDDGRIKIGQWETSVAVLDVSNYAAGKAKGSSHIIARFTPFPVG